MPWQAAQPLSQEESVRLANHYPSNLILRGVQLVHRHGARAAGRSRLENFPVKWHCPPELTAFETYHVPAHPTIFRERFIQDRQALPGTCYSGQMTLEGHRQLVRLGQTLRDRYVHQLKFLPSQYTADAVYVRATAVVRAKQSVQRLLMGLFRLHETGGASRSDVTFGDEAGSGAAAAGTEGPVGGVDVVDIHMLQERKENMWPDSSRCRRLAQLKKDFKETVAHARVVADEKPLRAKVAAALGMAESKLPSTHSLYDEFTSRRAAGLHMPAAVTPELIDELGRVCLRLWFTSYLHVPESVRLGIGRFVGDLRTDMLAMHREERPTKLFLYSGHDTTLGPVLCAFNVLPESWPDYGSSIAFELFTEEQDAPLPPERRRAYVRLAYRNGVDGMPHALPLPDCAGRARPGSEGTLCPLDAFLEIASRVIPADFSAECSLKDAEASGDKAAGTAKPAAA